MPEDSPLTTALAEIGRGLGEPGWVRLTRAECRALWDMLQDVDTANELPWPKENR
ncbi:MAG TPA: hypothetical protein VFX70_17480 [Mycobacteriales bacterium]|nr:hypothetical protein [Mycobacteriales bacterium]